MLKVNNTDGSYQSKMVTFNEHSNCFLRSWGPDTWFRKGKEAQSRLICPSQASFSDCEDCTPLQGTQDTHCWHLASVLSDMC